MGMNCRHHHRRPCPICSSDGYGPAKKYGDDLRKSVESYGAQYWYNQARFWMDKFMELDAKAYQQRNEGKGMCEMQEKEDGR